VKIKPLKKSEFTIKGTNFKVVATFTAEDGKTYDEVKNLDKPNTLPYEERYRTIERNKLNSLLV
jgi:hypothetical protein